MPVLNEDQIKAKIADGSIVAITLDTNIFDKYGCNLDFKIFSSLDQFKSGSIRVVFSEIVAEEIQRHICNDALEAERALKKALKRQKNRWKADFDLDGTLNSMKRGLTPKALAQEQIAKFFTAIDGEVIPASGKVDVSGEVIRRYFSGEHPFEKNEAKKHEFPDAFALLSLEKAFPTEGTMLLCVSNDGGWKRFAETSNTLVCVDAIDTALSYFEHGGRHVVDRAITLLKSGRAASLMASIETAIEYRLGDGDFIPVCQSHMSYEPEPLGGEPQDIDPDTISEVKIVSSNEEEITFTFKTRVSIEFEAGFHFQIYDSIDKDYVSLGTQYATTETEMDFVVLATIFRDEEGEPEASYVEVMLSGFMEIDFGYVEPFSDEDPADE